MSLEILGLATALPPHVLEQSEAEALARQTFCQTPDQASLVKVLYRRSGVQRRYTVLPHQTALELLDAPRRRPAILPPSGQQPLAECGPEEDGQPREAAQLGPTTGERMEYYHQHALPLALAAAGDALARSGLPPERITHLVTVSCTGFAAPGVEIGLIKNLGLLHTIERTHIGFMGCHGAINGLRVARALGRQPDAAVLLCAVELCSLHYRYQWRPEQLLGNVLFADGAAALVGVGEQWRGTRPRSNTEHPWRLVATGSCLLPDSEEAMRWQIGDHGFEMELSAAVPGLIARHLRPWLEGWLREHRLSLDEVGSWAVHPGGPRILMAVEESIGLPRGATAVSREVLAECGNMSSPTVLFLLERLRAGAAPGPVVALAFGPGLVAEAALFAVGASAASRRLEPAG